MSSAIRTSLGLVGELTVRWNAGPGESCSTSPLPDVDKERRPARPWWPTPGRWPRRVRQPVRRPRSWAATRSPGDLVDLGDDDDGPSSGRPRGSVRRSTGPQADVLVGGDAQPDDVDVGYVSQNQIVEALAQQRARPVQSGCIDQHDLEVLAVHDAADGVPGGLRALGGDGDLAAHQCVGQRRLTGVGPTDQADESGTEVRHSPASLTRRGA